MSDLWQYSDNELRRTLQVDNARVIIVFRVAMLIESSIIVIDYNFPWIDCTIDKSKDLFDVINLLLKNL